MTKEYKPRLKAGDIRRDGITGDNELRVFCVSEALDADGRSTPHYWCSINGSYKLGECSRIDSIYHFGGPAPLFKAGQKLKGQRNNLCITIDHVDLHRQEYTYLFDASGNQYCEAFHVVESAYQTEAPTAILAERKNSGKPQLSYLLSFSGGIEQAFEGSPFYEGLLMLSRWYRDTAYTLDSVVYELLAPLDDAWPELLARVSEFGAQKYARGNYLKGQLWSVICDSLLRHIRARDKGEATDADSGLSHDGHIAWNLLFLLHNVNNAPQLDDRLRAPEAA